MRGVHGHQAKLSPSHEQQHFPCGRGANPGVRRGRVRAGRLRPQGSGPKTGVARAAGGAEPTVLATVQHYARVLTQDAPALFDSLRHYRGLAVEPDRLPGRF